MRDTLADIVLGLCVCVCVCVCVCGGGWPEQSLSASPNSLSLHEWLDVVRTATVHDDDDVRFMEKE